MSQKDWLVLTIYSNQFILLPHYYNSRPQNVHKTAQHETNKFLKGKSTQGISVFTNNIILIYNSDVLESNSVAEPD